MTDSMKITNFLGGIQDTTAVTYAISTKAEPNVNTFEEFYNSFSAKLSSHITLTRGSNPARNINAFYAEGGHRGRGRGRGRGHRHKLRRCSG